MRIRSGDAEIFCLTMGDGPDIVLLHAFPSSHELWLPVAEMLARKYRVTLIDLRGHGLSGVGDGTATMQKHAADLAQVCKQAAIGHAVFAGVSIGGYVLFEFWRSFRQQVRGLILASTRASADTDEAKANRLKSAQDVLARGPQPFVDLMLPKLLGETTRRNRPDVVVGARKTMVRSTAAGIASVLRGMAERADSSMTLKTIGVPTLVVAGNEDDLLPMSDAELIHKNIRGSQLSVIPQAGHYAVFENVEGTLRAMRPFLDSLSH